MPAGLANVIATAVGTVPSFELNRRWVWRKTGKRSLARRGRSVLGAVVRGPRALHARSRAWPRRGRRSAGVSGATRTLVIEAANVAVFGSLWIAQFLILDRILFRSTVTASGAVAHSVPAGPGPSLTDKVAS